MTIYGLSQSSGLERLLEVARSGSGLQLRARERIGNRKLELIVVPTDDLFAAITDGQGGARVVAAAAGAEPRDVLDIEVRRNKVLLCVRSGAGGWHVAVGLDDLQDALEGAMASS